jgi:pimeloyl-ACP methyl ester carboxylesterase
MLLIHGWPETWYEWRKMMPLLARRFTVVAADLRGCGDSSLEPSGYDKKTLAQDMRKLMLKLGFRSAIVVGHDWGGPVAYAYAAQYRDAVEQLVLIEGAPLGPWTQNTNQFWFFNFLRIPGYAEKVLRGREREFLHYFYDNEEMHVVPGSFDPASIEAYGRAYAREGRMGPSYGLYRSIDQDVRDNAELAKQPLNMQILAVGAEKGAGGFVAQGARQVGVRVTPVLFRDTGHFIPEERPEALTDLIFQFVDGKPVAEELRP